MQKSSKTYDSVSEVVFDAANLSQTMLSPMRRQLVVSIDDSSPFEVASDVTIPISPMDKEESASEKSLLKKLVTSKR